MRALRLGRRPAPPYKLLSVFLHYPHDRAVGARDDVLAAVADLPPGGDRARLELFAAYWCGAPITELRQEYVDTFDLQRRSGLYLSYYVHGDTRKRGLSLLRLKRLYAAAGLHLDGGELPDYLPLMLEFAAFAPDGFGERVLTEQRLPLEVLRRSLHERHSPYAPLLDIVCESLPGLSAMEEAGLLQLVREGPPTESVGLQPFAPPDVMPAMQPRP